MRTWLIAVVAGALALTPGPVHAGKLGQLRSETQGSGSSGSSGGSGGGSSGSSGSSGGGSSGSSDGVAAAIGAAMLEAYVEHVARLYTRYPYADGARGFVLILEPQDDLEGEPAPEGEPDPTRVVPPEDEIDPAASDPPGQRLSGTFTLDGAALGPTVGRAGAEVELMVRRFGLALDVSPHLEIRPLDALSLGSAAFMTGVMLLPRVQVYAGIGANAMIDGRVGPGQERVDAFGVNGTFRATFLPARPVVLRARVDVGQLGAAPSRLGRVTAGVLLRRFELFGGYEVRRVGDVVLHGPSVGARVWF